MMARLKAWWAKAKLYEPARLAAAWSAVRMLAVVLAVTIPTSADLWVDALAGFLAVFLPLLQGERTRAAVDSPATVLRKEYVADGAGYRYVGEQATLNNLIHAGAKVVGISLGEHQRWVRSTNAEHLPRIINVDGQSDPDWPGIWALDASGYHHVASLATIDTWRSKGADEDTISRAEHDEWVRQVGTPA